MATQKLPELELIELECRSENFTNTTDDQLPGQNIPSNDDNNNNMQEDEEFHHTTTNLNFVLFLIFGVTLLFFVFYIQNVAVFGRKEYCQCLINKDFPQPNSSYTTQTEEAEICCTENASLQCTPKCDQDCKELCTNLALKNPYIYREKICDKENNIYRYMGFLYYRLCGQSDWKPLNLKLEVCCIEGIDFDCRLDAEFL